MASITASADVAAMEHEGDEWIANIQKQAARLARLVGDLVALVGNEAAYRADDSLWQSMTAYGSRWQPMAGGKERRMSQEGHFRHELKYGIAYPQYLELRSRLRAFMQKVPRAGAGDRHTVHSI